MSAQTLTEALVVTSSAPQVNLLPPEIVEGRQFRRTQAWLAAAVVAALAVAGGAFVLAQQSADEAAAELAVEQQQTVVLQAEQAQYAEVPRVIAQVDAAKAARAEALATDVAWYSYLNNLALTAPAEVWLTRITASVNPIGGVAAAAGPLATPGIGSVTFGGIGGEHADVGAWLDVLADIEGFDDPYFQRSELAELNEERIVNFESSVTLTTDALTDPSTRGER